MSKHLKHSGSIRVILVIFLFVFCVGSHAVWAAETMMTPALYDLFQKQAFFDAAFSATDPTLLTDDGVKQMIGESVFAGALPSVGVIVQQGTNYIAATGLLGAADGLMEKGSYHISMDPITDVCIVLPDNPVTIQKERENMNIYFQECKGKEKVIRQQDVFGKPTFSFLVLTDWLNNLWEKVKSFRNRNTGEVPAKPATGFGTISGEKQPIVTIKLINDANKNGSAERLETLVPWANVKIMFQPASPNASQGGPASGGAK